MSTRDLINLGISPDSGTGDSARRGGEKINLLFADIYTQLGDSPIGQDPSQPFYGYRRPFFEYEYKVGELHAAGRYMPVLFSTPAISAPFDATYGHGVSGSTVLVDTDGDGIPDIYRDSEWYFLSRGEQIDAKLNDVIATNDVHFVLPLAAPGDTITIRDSNGSWKDKFINVWTTPYEFSSAAQLTEWLAATGESSAPTTTACSVYNSFNDTTYVPVWKSTSPAAGNAFSYSGTASGKSPLPLNTMDLTRYEITFTYTGYTEGWWVTLVALDTYDLNTTIGVLNHNIAAQDSDSNAAQVAISHNVAALDSDTAATFVTINNRLASADSDILSLITIVDGGTFTP